MTAYNYEEPKFENIPQELRALPRWVTWRAEGAEGEKPRKIPYAPDRPHTRASSTDPYTWGSFEQAEAAYYDGDRTGIGFVLNNDGIVGVDIDHCITDGKVSEDAIGLLDWMDAQYVEVSPSGTGLRAFGYAPPLERGCKGKLHGLDIELYSTGRYLTLTGNAIKKGGAFKRLQHFEELAQELRGAGREIVNPETGEIETSKPHDKHAELIRRVLSGDVYHDSLRDLAASFVANGMRAGAAVSQLRALMQCSTVEHDDRWRARYKQIPALVLSAEGKFAPPEKYQPLPDDSPWLIPADDFSSQPAPISWLIKHWVQSQALIMVHGPSGGGKTFVVLDWCLRMASGMAEWAGNRVKPGPIVYLAGEGHHGMRSRVAAWKHHHNQTKLTMWLSRDGCDLNTSEGYVRASSSIEKAGVKPSLIVVDTLHRFMSGDENSAQDAKTMLDACNALMREFSCAVLLVHHTGVSEEAQHRARGSSAWRGALDIEVSIVPAKNNLPMQIIQRKNKDGELAPDIYAKLISVEIPGWFDEDGEQVTSAVLQIEEAPEKFAPEDKKTRDNLNFLEMSWIESGMEFNNGKPYLSRSFLVDKLQKIYRDTGRSEKTASNEITETTGKRMMATFLQKGIVSKTDHGFVLEDGAEAFAWKTRPRKLDHE